MFKKALFLLIVLNVVGCATTGSGSKLNSLTESGSLPEDIGIMLVSAGRGPSGSLVGLPFVSYGVYRQTSNTEMEKVAFLPGEAGLFNQLGKGKYGYIHLRELPAGRYALVGQKGRGSALDNPFGVLIGLPAGGIHYDSNGKKVGMSVMFEIDAGKVNYLGELLTISRDLGPDALDITDQRERDYAFAREKYPALDQLDFEVKQPQVH